MRNDLVGHCTQSDSPVKMYPVLVQIVNKRDEYKTKLSVCKIRRTQHLFGCGDFSRSYGNRILSDELMKFSGKLCNYINEKNGLSLVVEFYQL